MIGTDSSPNSMADTSIGNPPSQRSSLAADVEDIHEDREEDIGSRDEGTASGLQTFLNHSGSEKVIKKEGEEEEVKAVLEQGDADKYLYGNLLQDDDEQDYEDDFLG